MNCPDIMKWWRKLLQKAYTESKHIFSLIPAWES
jgi:hypothetical protein